MEFSIPAKHQVTRLLRDQRKRKHAFREWIDTAWKDSWAAGQRKLKGEGLYGFASAFEEQLCQTGLFDIARLHTPEILKLKTERSYDVSGFVLWPMTLGQTAEVQDAYAEDALMLVRLAASFSSKKTTTSEAPFQLGLTRHALERLVERGAVSGDLEGALAGLMPRLTRQVASTLACGIAKTRDDAIERTAYVPIAGGILVVTNRLIGGPLGSQDFGWRFNFTKPHYTSGYLKKDLLAPDTAEMSYRARGGALISAWLITTYLAPDQLTPRQRSYERQLARWLDAAGGDLSKHAVELQFDPDHVYRPQRAEPLLQHLDRETLEKLRDDAASNTFKSHPREAVSYLLDDDTSTRAFQSLLSARSGHG